LLIGRVPPGVLAVSESGLRTAEELLQLRQMGYGAFLIGERFMTAPDPGAALRALIARCGELQSHIRRAPPAVE
jgi:indole-3-glycerol phosphate synthase